MNLPLPERGNSGSQNGWQGPDLLSLGSGHVYAEGETSACKHARQQYCFPSRLPSDCLRPLPYSHQLKLSLGIKWLSSFFDRLSAQALVFSVLQCYLPLSFSAAKGEMAAADGR
jgi:hypothetical protein